MTPERAAIVRTARLVTVAQDVRELCPNAREMVHLLTACAEALEKGYGEDGCEAVLALSLVCTALERLQRGEQVDASAELALLRAKI